MQYNYTQSDIAHFWGKVDKDSSTIFYNGTCCWIWTGAKFVGGYGQMRMGGRQGRLIKTHRISYEINVGELQGNILVCHHCDNPICVNPDHLFQGTHQDNADDKVSKNRSAVLAGEDNPSSKLAYSQVVEIRNRYAIGNVTQRTLAKEFDVDQQVIWSIVNYRTWK